MLTLCSFHFITCFLKHSFFSNTHNDISCYICTFRKQHRNVCTHTDLKKLHSGGILTRKLLLKAVSIPSSCVIKIGNRVARVFLTQYTKKGGKRYQIATKLHNGQTIYQMAVVYSKWPKNTPTFSTPRTSKIYPNWYFLV
jgi:hypothetical protein